MYGMGLGYNTQLHIYFCGDYNSHLHRAFVPILYKRGWKLGLSELPTLEDGRGSPLR